MQRTTIMLPLELKAQAEQWAQERGISLSEFIRELLASALETNQSKPRAKDSLFADDAVFTGDVPTDLAENHDRYLYGNQFR